MFRDIVLNKLDNKELLGLRDHYNIRSGLINKRVSLIDKILDQRSKKIPLWVIIEGGYIFSAFKESNYDLAVNQLIAEIGYSAKYYKQAEIKITLTLKEYPENEVEGMLER